MSLYEYICPALQIQRRHASCSLILGKDILDTLELVVVPSAGRQFAIGASTDADVRGYSGSTFGVHGSMASVNRVGHLRPRTFCVRA
jgi:hypothetical protein